MPRSRCLWQDKNANVAVIFALSLVPTMGLTGLAVDYAQVSQLRAELQQVLDSSTLSGAREARSERTARASTVFAALSTKTSLAGAKASFELGATTTAGTPLKGSGSMTVPSRFGWTNYTVTAFSEVMAATATTPTTSACYVVLDPMASQSFVANSGAKIVAPKCQIDVKSTANPAAIVNAGTTLNIKKLCITGQGLFNGTPPSYQTGCATSPDPLAGKLPIPASGVCTYSNKTFDPVGGTREVEPGVWCGWNNFNGAQSIKFKPGLYVIKDGDITINAGSTVAGNDVTFYFVGNTNLRFNGTVTMNLAAPTSGTWAGILMAEAATSNKAQFIFNGVQGAMSGQIYLPNREIVLNATSKVTLSNFAMISNRLMLDTSEWTIASGVVDTAPAASSAVVRLSR